jgi:low affinity Fe/Cu permease
MVFLIQNTQNRDSKMIQIKIDELIRAVASARNQLLNLENLTDDDLMSLQKEFERLGKRAQTVGSKTRKSG